MVSEELAETQPLSFKSMLRIVESIRFFKVMNQSILHNPFKTFDDIRSQCNWSVTFRVKFTFAVVYWRDQGLLKCTWDFLLVETILPKTTSGMERASLHFYTNCAGKPSNPAVAVWLPFINCLCNVCIIKFDVLDGDMVTGLFMFEEVGFSEGTV